MSSKRHIRRKACIGKHAFDTQAEAAKQCGKMSHIYNNRLAVYHCQFCGKYHFGHPPREVRRALQAKGVIA